ncbi:MAG: hypothetical protein QOE32_4740, partial [Pseudonocardiales bacterium]|nr:hypothetical protein [Pseudonocardiales bacterium]
RTLPHGTHGRRGRSRARSGRGRRRARSCRRGRRARPGLGGARLGRRRGSTLSGSTDRTLRGGARRCRIRRRGRLGRTLRGWPGRTLPGRARRRRIGRRTRTGRRRTAGCRACRTRGRTGVPGAALRCRRTLGRPGPSLGCSTAGWRARRVRAVRRRLTLARPGGPAAPRPGSALRGRLGSPVVRRLPASGRRIHPPRLLDRAPGFHRLPCGRLGVPGGRPRPGPVGRLGIVVVPRSGRRHRPVARRATGHRPSPRGLEPLVRTLRHPPSPSSTCNSHRRGRRGPAQAGPRAGRQPSQSMDAARTRQVSQRPLG